MSDSRVNNSQTEKYNVFIDLDKTLLTVNSATILARTAHRVGLMRTRDLLNGLYLAILYKLDWRDPRQIINRMAQWMQGIREEVFISFADKISKEVLATQIRQVMLNSIHEHKKQGAKILMLSAALDYVCNPLAEIAGFDEVICSSLEINQGVFTGKPSGKLNFGEEKLARLLAYYEKNPGNPMNDYYYADSISDVYVMKKVGHPVAVDPDRKLKKHASHKGWQIIG